MLGQEQDSYGGSFDKTQAFRGKMTPCNIWKGLLDESSIMAMSSCKEEQLGSVISSESKSWEKIDSTSVTIDYAPLCAKDLWAEKLLLISNAISFDLLAPVCSLAGGKLPIPQSPDEVDSLSLEMDVMTEQASVPDTCGTLFPNFNYILVGQVASIK